MPHGALLFSSKRGTSSSQTMLRIYQIKMVLFLGLETEFLTFIIAREPTDEINVQS